MAGITAEQIIRYVDAGYSYPEIAKMLNVTRAAIYRILPKGKSQYSSHNWQKFDYDKEVVWIAKYYLLQDLSLGAVAAQTGRTLSSLTNAAQRISKQWQCTTKVAMLKYALVNNLITMEDLRCQQQQQ